MLPYDARVDIFSMGVVLFRLLTQKSPYGPDFNRIPPHKLTERKVAGQVDWDAVDSLLSAAGQDLLRWMLLVNPQARFTASQCLSHCWFDPIREEVATRPEFGNDDTLRRHQRK
jgi:serine/threonine protein kinase